MSVFNFLFRLVFRTGVVFVCIALFLTLSSFIVILLGFEGNPRLPAECGLVFGAAISRTNEPGPALTRRVGTAAKLFREGKVQRLIVSGGKGEAGKRSEADVMRELALELGVDASAIQLEDQSRSTWENLLFSRPLLKDCASVIGISDRYHLARIRLLAFQQGLLEFSTYPAEGHPPFLQERRSLEREVAGYLYYALGSPGEQWLLLREQ
jgi:uncharacterized SAM-binding protein YcdF (DUF218 family)